MLYVLYFEIYWLGLKDQDFQLILYTVGISGLKALKEPLMCGTPCGCSRWKVTKRGSHKKVTRKPFHGSLLHDVGQTTDNE